MLPDWSPPGHRDHLDSPPCSSELPLLRLLLILPSAVFRFSLFSNLVVDFESAVAFYRPILSFVRNPRRFLRRDSRILSAPPRTNPLRLSRTVRSPRDIKRPDSQSSSNVYCVPQRDWRHVDLPLPRTGFLSLQTRTLLSPAKLASAPLTRNDVLVLG